MSERYHVTGRIKIVDLKGKTINEVCRDILIENGITPDDDYVYSDHPLETQLQDFMPNKYIVINGNLYEVDGYVKDQDYDMYHANLSSDGYIDFEVSYYNGGMSLNDAIDIAVTRMIRDDIQDED